jgi:hypothetical protein
MENIHQIPEHQEEGESFERGGPACDESTSEDHSKTASTEGLMDTAQECICTNPSSAIDELQSAFRSILLARKHIDLVTDYTNFRRRSHTPQESSPTLHAAIEYDDSFALLSLPRELRDRIYFHYLHRPAGITYRRAKTRTFPFSDHSDTLVSLLLTSHQVCSEALQVFCRYNPVEIVSRNEQSLQRRPNHKALNGMLRLFPDTHARLLQRAGVSFTQYEIPWWKSQEEDLDHPNEAFVQALQDAYVFKNMFPKLREFFICFREYHGFFGIKGVSNFAIEGESEEEKIGRCLELMKTWMGECKIVPPRWFKFVFDDSWRFEGLRRQEGIWNEAYWRLAKDVASKQVPVEVAGKMWFEESCRGKKRK